jgi:glucosylceramidase
MSDVLPLSRRALLGGAAVIAGAATLARPALAQGAGNPGGIRWVVTTKDAPWRETSGAIIRAPGATEFVNVDIQTGTRHQTMEGFGGCFNEMGWDAMALLAPAARDAAFAELFGPDGARFTLCRMPIGANDFARDWYSHDETAGDFALDHFSVRHDETSLIPFIKAAQQHRPDLKLWASPWSPPSWMKTNGYYASVPNFPGWPANGLPKGAERHEGQDVFIQEPRYLDAYARYFGKFVDAYKAKGITIGMVMPQNEFNSAQPYPSCCWTPAGLARFLPLLGREMGKRDVKIFFGTLERGNEALFETVYADPAAGPVIKGLGVQWAGKAALPFIHHAHPDLTVYQSEQECGDGKNDWRYARYTWDLMKTYLKSGASAYQYWNIALQPGGVSRWGWPQNSLVTVDKATRKAVWNPEYWLMKHLSHFVPPGSTRIEASSFMGYEDALAFLDPQGRPIVVAHNPLAQPMPFTMKLGDKVIEVLLPADSFSTLVLAA